MKIDDREKCRSILRKHMESAVGEIVENECQGELHWSEDLTAHMANILVTLLVAAESCCVEQAANTSQQ